MRTIVIVTALAITAGACKDGKRSKPSAGSGTAGSGTAAPVACSGGERKGPLTWYEDDYPAALACARATARPLVIDMWAPWCHTCLSMSATVLVDPSLAPLAERFVWLALDTDREINAPVVSKFALQNWPTYFVIDPVDETIAGRWLGAAAIAPFRAFLNDGERTVRTVHGGGTADPLLAQVRAGDIAASAKDWKAADAAYGAALAARRPTGPRRSDILVAQISARQKAGDSPAASRSAPARRIRPAPAPTPPTSWCGRWRAPVPRARTRRRPAPCASARWRS
jgi:thiol-disulfide isomerase/thioredoxin